jgi:uncharacterized protein
VATLSRFNVYVPMSDGHTAVYNTFSGAYCIVGQALAQGLTNLARERGQIPAALTRAVPGLVRIGAVLGDDRDELELYRFRHRMAKFGNRCGYFLLFTARTCNFRCPYCYEAPSLERGLRMSREEATRVVKFMQRTILEGNCTEAVVGIYGGEPLVNPRISGWIMDSMSQFGRQRGLGIQHSLTTNGYHLQALSNMPVVQLATAVNITLDGPAAIHDMIRGTKGGKPSYRRIMRGIAAVRKLGKMIGVRIHYDKLDGLALRQILDDLVACGFTAKTRATIYLIKLEQGRASSESACFFPETKSLDDRRHHLQALAAAISDHSLASLFDWQYTLPNRPLPTKPITCGFDRVLSFAIDCNGILRKCGGMGDMLEVGRIDTDGRAIWNDTYFRLLAHSQWDCETCRHCAYLPACGGRCALKPGPRNQDDCRSLIAVYDEQVRSYIHSSLRHANRACTNAS